ncbi:protein phosphatase CheZ [Sulfuriferula nivalis]|uniref:Protein phosphatase CheZ n=2 Tax=Sulfuriferula nivalis TaxID=2675298 RepID=A0A809RK91_9PROT|nr:protein phosphatase CheZ [Sulfuriferula nivalis]
MDNATPKNIKNAEASQPNHDELLSQVGQLTRTLHDSLRELGFDKVIQEAAQEIPDVRDRLSYVAKLTEQAAQRVLNATDKALPLQENIAGNASDIANDWRSLLDQPFSEAICREMVVATAQSLQMMAADANTTKVQLMEIMMAQDFQDLTGQVIRKITDLAHNLESQLVQLLVEHAPAEIKREVDASLLNGPVINHGEDGATMASQSQVDDLLDSLGF